MGYGPIGTYAEEGKCDDKKTSNHVIQYSGRLKKQGIIHMKR